MNGRRVRQAALALAAAALLTLVGCAHPSAGSGGIAPASPSATAATPGSPTTAPVTPAGSNVARVDDDLARILSGLGSVQDDVAAARSAESTPDAP